MEEQDIDIINKETKKEQIINFINKNKKKFLKNSLQQLSILTREKYLTQ